MQAEIEDQVQIFYLTLCVWMSACMYVCLPHVCCAQGYRKRGRIPWNWSERCLWAVLWLLGTKTWSFGRAHSAVNCRTLSPTSGRQFWEAFWPVCKEMTQLWSSTSWSLSIWPMVGLSVCFGVQIACIESLVWSMDLLPSLNTIECVLTHGAPCLATQGDSSMNCCSTPTVHP